MARRQPTIIVRSVAVVAALVLWMCPYLSAEMSALCHNQPPDGCRHNQSGLCGISNTTVSCDHQLHQTEFLASLNSPRCQMSKFVKASECGYLQPSRVSTSEEPLVGMRLYHYSTWLGQRAVVNFTFSYLSWNDLKLQYKLNNSDAPLCRQFSLRGVSLPLKETLVFDCVALQIPEETVWDAELTVVTDKGDGRNYAFRLPRPSKINPWTTNLQNWHVFFYLHKDFIATSSHLPVTVQTDFPEASYNVSIVKCVDSECGNYSVLHYILVEKPKEDIQTVHLPIWSNPGDYAVTVQIVSDICSSEAGCYVSVSPKFEISPSLLGIWITIGMAFFLISFLTFLLIFNHRLQTNKRILQALKEVQPSVLMVYLPETQHHLDFIRIFAEFLKNSCHLLPYFVDRDLGIQDPNCWTRDHIKWVDKVLFIVPGKPEAESITPVRNQWLTALNYISGHHPTIHQMTCKVAVVVLPSSGSIPCEILHASRFKLMDEIGPLVTWLHDGTWLDEVFLWRPHIRSSNESVAHTWSEVRYAALRASLPMGILSANDTSSVSSKDVLNSNHVVALREEESKHSDDSTDTECASQVSECCFDPDIPSGDKLYTKVNSRTSINSDQLLHDVSDSADDDDGIFT